MVAFEAVIGSGGVAVVMVSGREDAGGVGLGRGGRRRGPDGEEAAEKGGKSRAAIIEDAGGERREIV